MVSSYHFSAAYSDGANKEGMGALKTPFPVVSYHVFFPKDDSWLGFTNSLPIGMGFGGPREQRLGAVSPGKGG